MPRLSTKELTELATEALQKAGASPAMAQAAANALVSAEMEGLAGHGISRVALYAQHLREGRVDGKAQVSIATDKGATCLIDAGGGLAFEASALAVNEAISRAGRFGVAFCGVTNSHHFAAR